MNHFIEDVKAISCINYLMRLRIRLLIGLTHLLVACGGSGSSGPTLVALPDLLARFPAEGANWNDYIQGSKLSSATDTACVAAVNTACINGGEFLVAIAVGQTSCTDLSASDDIGAFEWLCDDSSGTATFTSQGLKDSMNLSDLLNFNSPSWLANKVTVYLNNVAWGATPASNWWSNPVVLDNDGSDGSDMVSGEIRIVSINPQATYTMGDDGELVEIGEKSRL